MAEVQLRRRRTLCGHSGILHVFSEVVKNLGSEKVIETFGHEVTEAEIIGLYAKMMDVGVGQAEAVAPSWTKRAQDLAEEYGIRLKEAAR